MEPPRKVWVGPALATDIPKLDFFYWVVVVISPPNNNYNNININNNNNNNNNETKQNPFPTQIPPKRFFK